MAYNDVVQSIANAIKDALTLDDVVNGEPNKQTQSRLGRLIYSLATINHRVDTATTQANQKLNDLQNAINTAAAAGAGANGWTDALVTTLNGRTQRQKNLDTVNLLDYMTANELSAYQADATTFNAAPVFNRASVDCYNKKRKLMAYGTFYTTETIVITSDCDLSQADIFTTASLAIDVRNNVDTASVKRMFNNNIILPRSLKYTPKTGVGWTAGTVGIKFTNLYNCYVTINRVTGFETNVILYAEGTGNVYNEYNIGWLENGKINLLLDADSTGWTNENNIYGGRYSHSSSEANNATGTRHIKLKCTNNGINNNLFHKPSVEGDVTEYHLECGGSYNQFLSARWEANPPKVLFISDDALNNAASLGTNNTISGGYYVDRLIVSKSGTKSAFNNRTIGVTSEINPVSSTTGGYRHKNGSGNGYAMLSGFDAATDLNSVDVSQNVWSLSASAFSAKRAADANARISLDFINGKVLLGNGVNAPTVGLAALGTGAAWAGGDFLATTNTYNLGAANYRWKALYLTDGIGAWGATPPTSKPSVTGSRGGNAALASLITALASYGLIIDSTTA